MTKQGILEAHIETMKYLPKRLASLALIALLALPAILGWHIFDAQGATYTWDNGGGDGLWSTCTNWSTDTCPTSADIAQFDPGVSDTSSTIDASFLGSVAGINMMSGFTGTITQARTLTVGSSGFVLTSGTFTGASQTIDINGPLTLTAGTFTSTSGTLTLSGALTIGASNTFNHNSGTFTFDGASDRNVDVDTTETFNNVTISTSAASDDIMVASSDTLVAVGTLTLTNGQLGSGTIEAQGTTITKASGWDGGAGIVLITQNTVRNITWTSGPMSGLTLNAPNTTITINASSVFTYEGNLTVTSGTVTHGGSTNNTNFQGTFLVNGGTYVATPEVTQFSVTTTRTWGVTSGTFTHSNGTVALSATGGNLTLQGSTTFYDLVVRSTNNSYKIILPAGQTQTIENLAWFTTDNSGTPESAYIFIESSSSGSQASIDVQNKAVFVTTSLKDINNIGTSVACATRCIDRGNNTGFTFTSSVGVTVSDIYGSTSEAGGTATFTVVLDSQPQSDVTVPISSSDTTEGTVSSSTLTFTNGNWSTPQTVTVTGVADSTNDGPVSYTVTLDATTSSDSNFSGINPRDLTVVNTDDDTATATIEFEDTSDFTFEDVKNSTGSNITYYSHFYGGQGSLMTANGGSVVDITSSRIREGCIVRISGVDYNLVRVTDEPTYGYNVTLSRGDLNLNDLETELSAADGTVNSIRCLEFQSGNARLNDAFINYERAAFDAEWLEYDSTNNKIWGNSWLGFSTIFSISPTDLSTGSTTVGSAPDGLAYDSENDWIWVVNRTGDSVTAVDATTGGYAFGTQGASTFAVNDSPTLIEYDSENNALWITHSGSASTAVTKMSTADGSVIGTYTVGGRSYGVTRDTTRDEVWVLTYCVSGGACAVVLDATTGGYAESTLAASTYPLPYAGVATLLRYDATNDAIWVLDEVASTTKGFVYRLDALTGVPEDAFTIGGGGLDILYKSSTNEIWTANSNVGSWSVVDVATGREVREYQANECPMSLTLDGDGELWGTDCSGNTVDHMFTGVPSSRYYTITTTDSNQIDTTSTTSITSATVTQTLNSQTVHYAVSFDDRRTFSVFTGGAQRHIASNKNSVHGGTEGNWYYRNDASTWTAAASNSAEEAISLAVLNGSTNNRMTGATLASLTSSNWTTLGFSSGSTTTLDVSATLFTSDPTTTPTVESIAFTLASGGGGGGGSGSSAPGPIYTADETIAAEACSAERDIDLTLSGLRISDYMASEDPNFTDENWSAFDPDDDDGTSMTVPFTLSAGDGEKTVYAIFRSSTHDQSGIKNVVVELDTANDCADAASPEEPADDVEEPDDSPSDDSDGDSDNDSDSGSSNTTDSTLIGCEGLPLTPLSPEDQQRYRLGVSPMSGDFVPSSLIFPGDFIRSENFDTVYCITENRERRAFMDEITFFTQTRTFSPVKWVADETLTEFPLTQPMLPRENVSFLKFESDPSIYFFEQDALDPTHGILYWVTTEELAAFIAGPNWADYVIDLNPTLIDRFDMAAPFLTIDDVLTAGIDVSSFRARELLNEYSADESDPGITSSLLEQTRDALEAAGISIRNVFRSLKTRLGF